eukprot:31578_1
MYQVNLSMISTLCDPPQALYNCGPKPIYLQSKQDGLEYFIITLNGQNESVYMYSFKTDKFEIFKQYPETLTPLNHGHAVDPETNNLHIFGGDKRIYATLKLNVPTQTFASGWNIKCSDYKTGFISKLSKNKEHSQYGLGKLYMDRPEAIFLPTPFNQLHIFSNSKQDSILHIKYDSIKQKFIVVSELKNLKLFPASPVLYNETHRRIIMFGGFNTITFKSQIWYCNVYETQQKYEWKLFQTVIPRQSNYFDVILAIFDCVAIVFYFSDYDKKEIWCYDMQENKWYKSHVGYPHDKGKTFVIKTNNGWVHFLSFQNGYKSKYHFKIKILKFLPPVLLKKFAKKFECLVYGYCKEIDDAIDNSIIPVDIIQLIFKYHPLFNPIDVQNEVQYPYKYKSITSLPQLTFT